MKHFKIKSVIAAAAMTFAAGGALAADYTLSVNTALAQSDQVALEACRARGWVYRAQEATLVPRPPAPAAPAFESFEQLAQLTRIATHLTA